MVQKGFLARELELRSRMEATALDLRVVSPSSSIYDTCVRTCT